MRTGLLLLALGLVAAPVALQADDNEALKRLIIEKTESVRYRAATSNVPSSTLWGVYEKLEAAEKALVRDTGPEFFCKPASSFSYHVARMSDGATVGTGSTSLEDCQAFIRASTNGLICAPTNSFQSQIYRTRDLSPLGGSSMNETCGETIAKSSRDLVCAPSNSFQAHLTKILTGEKLGSSIAIEDCYDLIP